MLVEMISWFDSHSHLQDEAFDEDRDQVFARAKAAGVDQILLSTSFVEDAEIALKLAWQHEGLYSAMGLHPQEAMRWNDSYPDQMKELYHKAEKKAADLGRTNPIRAVGEIGLDYHWDTADRQTQDRVYRQQIYLAHDLGLPLIIHERDAFQDSYEILKWARKEGLLMELAGVCHCFSGSWEGAELLMDLGFMIGLDGPVTFKNGRKAKEIASKIDLEYLVLETDSPYLTPEPNRGKRNESSYLPYIGQFVADLRSEPVEKVAHQTKANAQRLFRLN